MYSEDMFEHSNGAPRVDTTIKKMPDWVVAEDPQQDSGDSTTTEIPSWESSYSADSAPVEDSTSNTTRTQDDTARPTAEPAAAQDTEFKVEDELSKRMLAYQQSVSEMLNVADLSVEFKQADGLISYLQSDREQIRVVNPQLETQIVELEEKLEEAKLNRQVEIQNELLSSESITKAIGVEGIDLDQLPTNSVDADELIFDPELGTIVDEEADGSGSINTKNGKLSFPLMALYACMTAYVLASGDSSQLRLLTKDFSGLVFTLIGVDPEITNKYLSRSDATERTFFSLSAREIKDIFENRIKAGRRDEIVTLLAGLTKENRIKLLEGKRVSGGFPGSNTHQLEEPLIGNIIATLRQRDIEDLNIEAVVAQRQTQTR